MDNIKNILYVVGAFVMLSGAIYGAVTFFTPQKTFHVVTEEIKQDVAGLKLSDKAQAVERSAEWERERLNRLEDRKDERKQKNLPPPPGYKERKRELEQRLQRLKLRREKIQQEQLKQGGK